MNAVEKHPQRQQIIDAILAGESLRAIGARVVPHLHHTSIARFKLQLLKPAIHSLRGVSPERNRMKSLALSAGINGDAGEQASLAQDAVRQEIHNSVSKLDERLEAWIADAEKANEGKPLHPALSAHTRNVLSSLELRAKLSGLLTDGTVTTINVAMVQADSSPSQAQEPPSVTIDV